MASVTLLAQYLLRLDPQKSIARISFYHFLKNCCDMGEEITPSLIQRFYRRALHFQYWQTHQETLGQTVEQDLLSFHGEMPLPFHPKDLRHAQSLQLVQIKQDQDIEKLLSGYFQDKLRPAERLKLIPLGEMKWMALRLSGSGMLDVEVFGSWSLVDGSKLIPLEPLSRLSYSSHLELMPHMHHYVESGPMTSTRFQLVENGIQGHTIRGYSFQKYETLQGGSLSQHSELFFALKKIERIFVQAETDPFYQELVGMLEKSYNMLSAKHPDAAKMAEAAVAKGQQALKTVFPHDKLLLLLVTNIEFLLGQKARASGDIWRKPKPLTQ